MSDELKPLASVDSEVFRNLLTIYRDADSSQSRAAQAALIAHIDAWRVPPGYKLGPIGSTAEMDLAGRNAMRACGNEQATTRDAELCWSAMIDAAPDKGDACGP